MQAYFGERVHFDQASAILDSNLEVACKAGARKGKGDRARAMLGPSPRAPIFPSPFPFLAPATQADSEEAWGETKMRPREWELGWKENPPPFPKPIWRRTRRIYDRELQYENACTAG